MSSPASASSPPVPSPGSALPEPIEAADFPRAAVERVADPIARLRVVMKRLLDPGGCPWDREQTHASLKKYLIEEAYEVCEAIDRGDDAETCEELGDVALQVVFHAELAERRGAFRLEDVYEAIARKLIDRHPHVFGEVVARDSETVLRNWEAIKKEEKRRKAADGRAKDGRAVSVLDGVPAALPALQRACRLQEKAAKVGFDWDRPDDVAAKVREEVEEFLEVALDPAGSPERLAEELGDVLFSLTNLARHLRVEPEEAARGACARFDRRFRRVESLADEAGRDLRGMTLPEMDELWNRAKSEERG